MTKSKPKTHSQCLSLSLSVSLLLYRTCTLVALTQPCLWYTQSCTSSVSEATTVKHGIFTHGSVHLVDKHRQVLQKTPRTRGAKMATAFNKLYTCYHWPTASLLPWGKYKCWILASLSSLPLPLRPWDNLQSSHVKFVLYICVSVGVPVYACVQGLCIPLFVYVCVCVWVYYALPHCCGVRWRSCYSSIVMHNHFHPAALSCIAKDIWVARFNHVLVPALLPSPFLDLTWPSWLWLMHVQHDTRQTNVMWIRNKQKRVCLR